MKKTILTVVLIILLTYSIGGIYFHYNSKEEKEPNITTIKDYNYTLKDNASELMKKEFHILKENLEGNEINEEEYVKSIAKLFIIDVYTMNNKINKYDIGGTEYIYPSSKDNFILNITNTLYKYLENNEDNKRNQELPEVSAINIEGFEKFGYILEEETKEAYKINLSWDYTIDYEYEKECEIILIKENNLYYIAEKK